MVLAALRNLRSRAGRTVLTVAGIAIGIFAFVVAGSLAERLGTIVTRSTSINSGSVFARANGRVLFDPHGGVRIAADLRKIREFPGVARLIPEIVLPYGGSESSDRFGPPAFIFGVPFEARSYAGPVLGIGAGRDYRPGERRSAVVGADFAASRGVRAGDVIALYGNSYTVTGILSKSFTVFDAGVIVPFEEARDLVPQLVPPSAPSVPDLPATAAMVIVAPGADAGAIARRITLLTGFEASDPAEVASNLQSTTRVFDAIVFGAALLALLVGAFSIVNTMTIAVTERTREIGIRKAIGAGDGDILREFLWEAGAIGSAGGVIGLGAATALVAWLNLRNAARGDLELFAVTPRLAIGAIAFAVLLSLLSGAIPAIRAARLEPTDALRRAV
jgi:putative ABC transport system permease protein